MRILSYYFNVFWSIIKETIERFEMYNFFFYIIFMTTFLLNGTPDAEVAGRPAYDYEGIVSHRLRLEHPVTGEYHYFVYLEEEPFPFPVDGIGYEYYEKDMNVELRCFYGANNFVLCIQPWKEGDPTPIPPSESEEGQ